jgi:putative DNA primase/helicase
MVWTGTHWQRDASGVVMQLAKHTIKNLARLLPSLDDKQAFALLAHIKSSLSTAKLKAMMENAQSEEGVAVQPGEFDRDVWLLNCTNGTIDLRTATLRNSSRTDLITKCLSVAYNPDATCPRWEAFLDRVMDGKQGLVAFLHRAIGYSLTGSTIEQCMFILHGPTKTGKTTFLARLRALLGPYGTQADMESFMHKDRQEVRNDLADLAGARVVCAVEAQEGRRLNENLIKQLTGGVDQVKARFLFEEYFTYTPQYKIFLGSNHKPVIKDNDQAIWERIRLVPFVVQIPVAERDKNLDTALQEEIAGILAWAVRGSLEWQRRGDLEPPPEVLTATQAYQHESDVLGRFIDECCITLVQAQVRPTPLYEAYKAWCDQNGERYETMHAIGTKLVERGFEKRNSHGTVYLGIGLRSQDND